VKITASDFKDRPPPERTNASGERGGAPETGKVSGAQSPKSTGGDQQGWIDKRLLFANAARSLGLPPDKLSASIITFARFFSLPMDPALLGRIRRQAIPAAADPQQTETQTRRTATGDTNALRVREALSLAAAAAADKGVVLSNAALEEYAAAIDPEKNRHPGAGSDANAGSGGNADGGSHEDGSGGGAHSHGQDSGGSQGRGQDGGAGQNNGDAGGRIGRGDLNADESGGLSAKILKLAEDQPLLSLLNRLPGKNGQRWVVLPFSFSDGGLDCKVSLRILLKERGGAYLAEQMALEIAEKRRLSPFWIFSASRPAGGRIRLDLSLWPEASEKTLRSLKKELSRLFEIPEEAITLRNNTELSSFGADTGDEVLLSINKEV
jgi:hypothetical protein